MVFGTGEDWQIMTCPVCELHAALDAMREPIACALAYLVQLIDTGEANVKAAVEARTQLYTAMAILNEIRPQVST